MENIKKKKKKKEEPVKNFPISNALLNLSISSSCMSTFLCENVKIKETIVVKFLHIAFSSFPLDVIGINGERK